MKSPSLLKLFAIAFFVTTAACGTSGASMHDASESSASAEVVQDADAVISRAVSIRIPVIDDRGLLISRFNPRLRAMGQPPMPSTVVVSNTTGRTPFDLLHDRWQPIYSSVAADATDMRAYSAPEDYVVAGRPSTALCYSGNPYYLGNLLASLADSVMSDQFGLVGWKSGRGVYVASDMREFASEFPADWASYVSARRDVLVLFVTSDGGDNYRTNSIPRCSR